MAAGLSRADEDKKWRAECDMRTLMEAETIKADPKRLKAAQAMAKEKMMEAAKVAGSESKS
ncbi:MAG TPA: hypothetical protein VFV57_05940 [Limnobacter sp.]|nr:hypothetical protein [Limnobacter sp.]